ncbi:ABC transporter substrate-binding protein [Candidatus Phycosocius spiralis]|uniref:ABC transporter substrate-binding protein n=1 Tax=Candidatus Phycosocius spiralis TaxID=2815099 RepID=UPI0024E1901D|nr:ABC transporter substrate-binding protein [Candidatus Phycosocius spiralis]
MLRFSLTLIVLLAAAGCTAPPPKKLELVSGMKASQGNLKRPQRIVSLDYCADQFVLKLAKRSNILALSPDATRAFSYMRNQAIGLPKVRARAEDVLGLRPDLIVRSYGGGHQAQAFFEQVGVKVHQIDYASDIVGITTTIKEVAQALGEEEAGDALTATFKARLAALKPAPSVSALYITPGGITTGPGSMIDKLITQAGLTNFQTEKGWHPLPLERLVTQSPQLALTAQFGAQSSYQDYWSSARHPIMRDMMTRVPVVRLDGSTLSCGGWFVLDAMETMAKAGHDLGNSPHVLDKEHP